MTLERALHQQRYMYLRQNWLINPPHLAFSFERLCLRRAYNAIIILYTTPEQMSERYKIWYIYISFFSPDVDRLLYTKIIILFLVRAADIIRHRTNIIMDVSFCYTLFFCRARDSKLRCKYFVINTLDF